jgi:topoisomerase IV subunit A
VETVTDEPVTVILSRNGFIRSRSGHGIDRAALAWKESDAELAIRETRTVLPVVLFGANGRVFNVRPTDIPGGKGDGVPVSSLIDTQGTAIVGMLTGAPETPVLLGTTGGNVLRAKMEAFATRIRAGKQFVGVGEGESLLFPMPIAAEAKEVAALSRDGRLLVFPLDEVPELANGGKGVMAMRVHEGEAMVGVRPVEDVLRVAVIGRGDKRNVVEIKPKDLAHYRGNRARTGRVLPGTVKKAEGFE